MFRWGSLVLQLQFIAWSLHTVKYRLLQNGKQNTWQIECKIKMLEQMIHVLIVMFLSFKMLIVLQTCHILIANQEHCWWEACQAVPDGERREEIADCCELSRNNKSDQEAGRAMVVLNQKSWQWTTQTSNITQTLGQVGYNSEGNWRYQLEITDRQLWNYVVPFT